MMKHRYQNGEVEFETDDADLMRWFVARRGEDEWIAVGEDGSVMPLNYDLSSDWTPWQGFPSGKLEVEYANGDRDVGYAGMFSWTKDNGSYNIIAYRILDE